MRSALRRLRRREQAGVAASPGAGPERDAATPVERLATAAPPGWDAWWEARGERELRCILMTAWDPAGTGADPASWDEYDDYVPEIVRRLRDGSDPRRVGRDLAGHLRRLEVDVMGVAAKPAEAYLSVAEVLVAWHEWSFDRGGRAPGPARDPH